MAKQKTTPKFELATLDANNLKELDGWKDKMETAVKEFPFVKITDSKTYEEAKTNRTGLRSTRTDVQKQDKLIGSFVSNFRKDTKKINESLIAVVLPSEEKQQAEIDRHEKILEEKRHEKELAEQKRVDNINNKINSVKDQVKKYIDSMSFGNIKETETVILGEFVSAKEFNFEEFEPMIDELISDLENEYKNEVARLEHNESVRLEQLEKDQEAKINSIWREASTMIDQANGIIEGHSFENTLNKLVDTDFDFGKYQEEFEQTKKDLLFKAKEKTESLQKELERRQEIQKQENINRINQVREGLLDKIFQMTVDNYKTDVVYVEEALEQENPFPELKDKFETMITTVKKNLDSKMKMINAEVEQIEQEWKDARIAIDARTKQRGEQLEEIGFVFNKQKTENFWNTLVLDFEVWESMIEGLSDEDWTPYFNEIKKSVKDAKAKNKAFQERQKRLKTDKQRMCEFIEELPGFMKENERFIQHDESKQLFGEIQGQLELFVKTKIETINKF